MSIYIRPIIRFNIVVVIVKSIYSNILNYNYSYRDGGEKLNYLSIPRTLLINIKFKKNWSGLIFKIVLNAFCYFFLFLKYYWFQHRRFLTKHFMNNPPQVGINIILTMLVSLIITGICFNFFTNKFLPRWIRFNNFIELT